MFTSKKIRSILLAVSTATFISSAAFADDISLTITDETPVDWSSADWSPATFPTAADNVTITTDGVMNGTIGLNTSASVAALTLNDGTELHIGVGGSLTLTAQSYLNNRSSLVVEGVGAVLNLNSDTSRNEFFVINADSTLEIKDGAVLNVSKGLRIANSNNTGYFIADNATINASFWNARNIDIQNSTVNTNETGNLFMMHNDYNNLRLSNTVVNGKRASDGGYDAVFFVVGNAANITIENGSVINDSSYVFGNPSSTVTVSNLTGANVSIGWWSLTTASHINEMKILSGSKFSANMLTLGNDASGRDSTDGALRTVIKGDYDSGTGVTRTSELVVKDLVMGNGVLVAGSKTKFEMLFEGYQSSQFNNVNMAANANMNAGEILFQTSGIKNVIYIANNLTMNGSSMEDSTLKNTLRITGGTEFRVGGSTYIGLADSMAGEVSIQISGTGNGKAYRLDAASNPSNVAYLALGNINLRLSTYSSSTQVASLEITGANVVAASQGTNSGNIQQGTNINADGGETRIIMNSSDGVGGAVLAGGSWYMGSAQAYGGYNYAEIKGTAEAMNTIAFYALEMRNSEDAYSALVNRVVIGGYTQFSGNGYSNPLQGDSTFRPRVATNVSASGLSELIFRGDGNYLRMWQMMVGNAASTGGIGRIRLEGKQNSVEAVANLQIIGGVGTSRDNIVGGVLELVASADGLPGVVSDRVMFTGVLVLDFTLLQGNGVDPETLYTFTLLTCRQGWNNPANSTGDPTLLIANSWENDNELVDVIKANADDIWEIFVDGNTLKISYTWIGEIPEPSTYALVFGLVAIGFAAYRRKAKKN